MVESSNTEFGQSDDPQKGRSLDRDRQGSMPVAGPEMNRHLRRAGYARRVGELGDVDLETAAPQNGQALVWNEDAGGDPYNPENNSGPTGAWVPGSGGGTVLIEVHNATGSTLTLGMPVYVSGTHASGKPEVAPAQANSTSTMPAIGLVQADIAAGVDGYVVAGGALTGPTFDTTSYVDGDPLYVDPDNAGQLVNARPSDVSPEDLVQKVALVTRAHATVGSVIVMGAGRVNDIPNALGDVTALGLTSTGQRLLGRASVGEGALEEIQLESTLEFSTGPASIGLTDGGIPTIKVEDGAITGVKLASGGQYHGAYNTQAETQRSGATATTEIYYTARPDGDGYAESEVDDSGVPVGDTVVREIYFHDEFDADPDGAGWTAYTTQPSFNETFANAKAALLAGLNDTDGTANTRGTLPLSLKMERAVVTNLLLNDYPGAEAAYSLRKLDRNYTGDAIRIREDGGNTETDIGFTTGGDLDTTAIASHCGANNGYVVTWYDQANSNDLTNSTAANQPRIYNGTTHATFGSRAAVEWVDGQNYWLDCTFASVLSQPVTHFAAARYNGVSGQQEYVFDSVDGTDRQALLHLSGNDRFHPFAGQNNWGSVDTTAGSRLFSILFSSSGVFRKNGTQDASGSFGSNSIGGLTLGNYFGHASDYNWDDVIAEHIVYGSDQSSNFSDIESDIGTYYAIPEMIPLLDTYSGAAAAYSVRLLRTAYTGNCMKVRRDSDDATQDIGFDANGDLDTAAIATFCTTANGYVDTWYDQSGNGEDVTQSTTTSQPQIYNGTATVTNNGNPALLFSNDYLLNTTLSENQPVTTFGVYHLTGGNYVYDGAFTSTRNALFAHGAGGSLWQLFATTGFNTAKAGYNIDELVYGMHDGANSEIAVNGGTATTGNVGIASLGGLTVGARFSIANYGNGYYHEIIVFGVDQSANRSGIESHVNTYFSIY